MAIDVLTVPPGVGPVLCVPPASGAVLTLPLPEEAPPFNGLVSVANLVSYWTLDEASGTRVDSVGTNHLTPTNAPVGVAGKIGNGCDFESTSSQYLSRPDSVNPLGNEDFTYTLWFKRESFEHAQLIGKDYTTSREYTLYFDATSATLVFTIYNTQNATILSPPVDTNWHFIVAWHNTTTKTVNIQLDNGTVFSGTYATFAMPSAGREVRIGAREYPGFEHYFDGLIDEVGLWRRVLTAPERTALWNGGAGLKY